MRWIDSALSAGELLYDRTEAVHLMDREGDSYELFSFLLDNDQRFVIRLCHDRRREGGREAPKMPKLFEALSESSYFFEREVTVSERNQGKKDGRKKSFSERRKRTARPEVRASSQEIFISNGGSVHLPASMKLNWCGSRTRPRVRSLSSGGW